MAINVLLIGFFHLYFHLCPILPYRCCREVCVCVWFFLFCLVPNFLCQQELGSILDHADKFPVGTKVQAVYSEDGEWWVGTSGVNSCFFLFQLLKIFYYSHCFLPFLSLSYCWLVDFPGMMLLFTRTLQMAIMSVMMNGVTRKRYCLLLYAFMGIVLIHFGACFSFKHSFSILFF